MQGKRDGKQKVSTLEKSINPQEVRKEHERDT